MQEAYSLPSCNNQRCLQTLPGVPWRTKLFPVGGQWYSTGSHIWPCIKHTWEALETVKTIPPPKIPVLFRQGSVLVIGWFIGSSGDSNVQLGLRTTGQKYLLIDCKVVKPLESRTTRSGGALVSWSDQISSAVGSRSSCCHVEGISFCFT